MNRLSPLLIVAADRMEPSVKSQSDGRPTRPAGSNRRRQTKDLLAEEPLGATSARPRLTQPPLQPVNLNGP